MVIEWWDRLVERQELDIEEWAGDELEILVAFNVRGILEVDLIGDVDLAGL